MVQLGLWAAPDLERVRNRGATGTHAVHAVMPLSEVVANYGEVADTLRGGVGALAGAGRESPAEDDAQEYDARRAWSSPGSELDIELRQGGASFAADEV